MGSRGNGSGGARTEGFSGLAAPLLVPRGGALGRSRVKPPKLSQFAKFIIDFTLKLIKKFTPNLKLSPIVIKFVVKIWNFINGKTLKIRNFDENH